MPPAFISVPDAPRFTLANARVPLCLLDPAPGGLVDGGDGLALADIDIADGRIVAIRPAGGSAVAGLPQCDLDGGQAWACFVDPHTHIDKGHIWPRAANPDGSRAGAIAAVDEDTRANWTAADVARRMDFSLRCAYAHGVAAIRTHIDSYPPQHAVTWPVLPEIRAEWAGRIDLQFSALVTIPLYEDEAFAAELADTVAASGGVLGAVTTNQPVTDALLDRVFELAADRGLDLDFHVDETGDPDAATLAMIAEATLRNRFGKRSGSRSAGRVVVGHCCAVAQQPGDRVDRVLDLVAEAGLHVVSLPMCNMYLQDRGDGRTPRWRGVTLLHEMKARGISVSIGSDNTRDPFHAYGDLDGLEVFTQAAKIAHLDHPVGDWPQAVTRTPADAMGLADAGRVRVGGPADLVLFRARFYSELLSRPQTDRVVLRQGRAIDTTLPDYRELDDLFFDC